MLYNEPLPQRVLRLGYFMLSMKSTNFWTSNSEKPYSWLFFEKLRSSTRNSASLLEERSYKVSAKLPLESMISLLKSDASLLPITPSSTKESILRSNSELIESLSVQLLNTAVLLLSDSVKDSIDFENYGS